MLGFFHPLLDSLDIEPPLREVMVTGDGTVRADLAIPSAESFRKTICGREPASASNADAGALIVGIVRHASDQSAAVDATVSVEWLEFSFTASGVARRDDGGRISSARSLHRGATPLQAPAVAKLSGIVLAADGAKPVAGALLPRYVPRREVSWRADG